MRLRQNKCLPIHAQGTGSVLTVNVPYKNETYITGISPGKASDWAAIPAGIRAMAFRFRKQTLDTPTLFQCYSKCTEHAEGSCKCIVLRNFLNCLAFLFTNNTAVWLLTGSHFEEKTVYARWATKQSRKMGAVGWRLRLLTLIKPGLQKGT